MVILKVLSALPFGMFVGSELVNEIDNNTDNQQLSTNTSINTNGITKIRNQK